MHLNSNRLCLDGACERETKRGGGRKRERKGEGDGEEEKEKKRENKNQLLKTPQLLPRSSSHTGRICFH